MLFPLILVGIVAGICVVVGLILLIVPGLILLTIWAVASPVVVVENPGVFESLAAAASSCAGTAGRSSA